jgi:hypothetical protein
VRINDRTGGRKRPAATADLEVQQRHGLLAPNGVDQVPIVDHMTVRAIAARPVAHEERDTPNTRVAAWRASTHTEGDWRRELSGTCIKAMEGGNDAPPLCLYLGVNLQEIRCLSWRFRA